MRKLKFIMLPLLLLLLHFPTQAQGGLLNVINSDDQFSILAEAIAAADPSVSELLSNGNYTLLAPNDIAFENLASFLDMDLDVLLAQQSIITDLLLYHMLEGNLYSPQLISQYDGSVIPTLLQNAFVNIDVLDDGTIQLNDVAEVIAPDIAAGNSVIHVLNDVLLNRVITRQIEAYLSGEDSATEEATEVTETPETSAEAQVRVLHAAPEFGALSVRLDGVTIADGLTYGEASEFVTVPLGEPTATFAINDTQPIAVEGLLTLLFVQRDGEEILIPIDQSAEVGDDEARVILVNALLDVDPVILQFDGEEQEFAFGDEEGILTSVGSHSVAAVINGETVSEVSFVLPGSSRFLVVLIGTSDAPQLVRLDVSSLTSGSSDAVTENARQSLATLLSSDERFSLLYEAAMIAGDELLQSMDAADTFTVFAPTNEAFEDLLVSAGVNSLDDLDSRLVRSIVLYHIIPGDVRSDALIELNGQSLATQLGDNLITFGVRDDGNVEINAAATVIEADVVASNGVLHLIDTVLLPQSVLDELGF